MFQLTCIQDLCRWITNNWRPLKAVNAAAPPRRTSRLEIVWKEHRQACIEEIKAIMNNDNLTDSEAFNKRLTGAAAVYSRLTEDEQADIMRRGAAGEKQSNPPDIQAK